MDKIDIHDSDEAYKQALVVLKNQLPKTNYDLIMDYLNASAIGKTARKNATKKQVSVRGRLKNLYLLKVTAKFMKKDLNKVTTKDMEKWVRALNENKIKKEDGKNYSEQTKANIKATFIQFLRYTLNDPRKYSELTDWIETSFKKREIPALSEEDIKKMLDKCFTPQQKAIVATLFDSGSRIEEFLNLRISDVSEVKSEFPYYKITIRNETSKTAGRTLGLFWKPTTQILRQWLEDHPNANKLSSPLFPTTYDGVRKVLNKISQRAIDKKCNPHLFRHSSATYYAGEGLDYFQMCKRYGWSIGSNMPHTYIDRAGIKEKEFADKVVNKNVRDLAEKYERLIHEANQKDERLKGVEEELSELKSMIAQWKK